MSVHAALARPVIRTPRGRHAKPGPGWPRVAVRVTFLALSLVAAAGVVGAGWPPVLLVVPVAALVLLVASVTKLRTAARKIDTIFAEELSGTATRETVPENTAVAEIS
jgi:Flp pilus assembly protein TadB